MHGNGPLSIQHSLVPRKGLEPPRSYPLVPETSASTNSATWAFQDTGLYHQKYCCSGCGHDRRRSDERGRRHRAGPSRRAWIRHSRRPHGRRNLSHAAGNARRPAPGPGARAHRALRPPRPARRARAGDPGAAQVADHRPPAARERHLAGGARGQALRAGHPDSEERHRQCTGRAGRGHRVDRAAVDVLATRRPRRGGAGRDRRPRHGDRNRGPQVRSAAPILGRDDCAGGGVARAPATARPQAPHRPQRRRAGDDRRRGRA